MNQQSVVRKAFRDQAIPCRDLGSPFTARLCEMLADRLDDSNAVGRRVLSWTGDPGGRGDVLPLRLCGALHALVIENTSPQLISIYPPQEPGDDMLWWAVENALVNHSGFILKHLGSPPQTNEVRRSSILLPGFWQIARLTGLPFVLSELGASAGLNLHWDKFRFQLGEQSWGDEISGVRMVADWAGPTVAPQTIAIQARAGCDLNPLDPADKDDQNRLLSYIWPDQLDRLARTRAAFEIAGRSGIKVEQADAIDWLQQRLAVRYKKSVHVIYHTIAWQYFPQASKLQGEALLEAAGGRATADAPLAWLRFEADGKSPGAALKLTLWPGGEEHYLARADYHGRWIDWQG